MSGEERKQLIILRNQSKTYIESLKGDMTTAFTFNEGKGEDTLKSLKPLTEEPWKSFDFLLYLLNTSIIDAQVLSLSTDTFCESVTKSIESSLMLFDDLAQKLDKLCEIPVDGYKLKTSVILISFVIILPMIAYFYIAFTLSILIAVQEQKIATGEISKGNLLTKVEINTNDEMHDIALILNTVVETFRNIIRTNNEMSGSVALSSSNLTGSMEQTVKGAEEIASTNSKIAMDNSDNLDVIKNSSKSVTRIVEDLSDINHKLNNVSGTSQNMAGEAIKGKELLANLFTKMGSIYNSFGELTQFIHALEKSSYSIQEAFHSISSYF